MGDRLPAPIMIRLVDGTLAKECAPVQGNDGPGEAYTHALVEHTPSKGLPIKDARDDPDDDGEQSFIQRATNGPGKVSHITNRVDPEMHNRPYTGG